MWGSVSPRPRSMEVRKGTFTTAHQLTRTPTSLQPCVVRRGGAPASLPCLNVLTSRLAVSHTQHSCQVQRILDRMRQTLAGRGAR